ncbi:hypothetical protein BST61_g5746 [Cercospora zeina]
MLRDATPIPQTLEESIGDVSDLEDVADEHMSSIPPASPQAIHESAVSATKKAKRDAPFPSTAPVRSLGSEKVVAAPPSTAPKRPGVAVIDLDTSDESDAEDNLPLPSQSMQVDPFTSQDVLADPDDLDDRSYSSTEVASSPAVGESADIEMLDVVAEPDASHEMASEPDLRRTDALASLEDQQNLVADEMQPNEVPLPAATPMSRPSQSQVTEAPSTQSKTNKMADHYHYFSFQSMGSDVESSDVEDENTAAELTEQAPQSFDKPFEYNTQQERHLPDSRARANVQPSSAPSHIVGPQQSQQPTLPSPMDSQPLQQAFSAETQHQLETQPFETQLPIPLHSRHILLPTPEITNEGLELAADAPVEEEAPSVTPKRKHTRKVSAKGISPPVRRSPRNAESQVEHEVQGTAVTQRQTRSQRTASPEPPQVTARRQTRSQRTASPEPSQISTKRQTRSQRTATPETTRSSAASFDSTFLSPAPVKPLRRSPRKSQAQTESFDEIMEPGEKNTADVKPRKAATSKSARKQQSQQECEDEVEEGFDEDATLVSEQDSSAQQPHVKSADVRPSSVMNPPPSAAVPKIPSRKSLASRIGQVPEVISSWFSPRRSTRQQLEEDTTLVDDAMSEKADLLQSTASNGLITSAAYYTPLSNLHEKLNPSSQPGVDNTIDILAVVVDDTKAPERAKGGPRDFFTILKIADPSSSTPTKMADSRVEVFRPWHATLPVAQKGDVVLLRGFGVKSRKRRPYLLSTDASAWLVWRFGEDAQRPGSAGSPKRSRRRGSLVGLGVKEEVKGPPVELGSEERQRAKELREWWQGVSGDAEAAEKAQR